METLRGHVTAHLGDLTTTRRSKYVNSGRRIPANSKLVVQFEINSQNEWQHNCHKLFKFDHSCAQVLGHYLSAMKKELSPERILAVRCPTCGAAPGKKCELGSGQPRTEPHRDRRLIAKD
jgi:hypothetical protein